MLQSNPILFGLERHESSQRGCVDICCFVEGRDDALGEKPFRFPMSMRREYLDTNIQRILSELPELAAQEDGVRAALRQIMIGGEETAGTLDLSEYHAIGKTVGGVGDQAEQLTQIPVLRGPAIKITPFAKIETKPINWIWKGWIPRGMFMIWQGNPGFGKSMTLVSLASAITRASTLPGTTERAPYGFVLWVSAEESPSMIIRPRLEAAGADLERVFFLDNTTDAETGDQRPFNLAMDLEELESLVNSMKSVVCIVLDTLTGFLGDRVNTNANHEVRPILQRVAEFSDRTGVTVIGINHLAKIGSGNASLRGLGAGAINAVARQVVQVGADPSDPDARVLAIAKNNLCKPPKSLRFHIVPSATNPDIGVVNWGESCDVTADDMVADPAKDQNISKTQNAERWLLDQLRNGSRTVNDLCSQCECDGFPWWAVRDAKQKLGGKISKEKDGMRGGWRWMLAPDGITEGKDN